MRNAEYRNAELGMRREESEEDLRLCRKPSVALPTAFNAELEKPLESNGLLIPKSEIRIPNSSIRIPKSQFQNGLNI